jgi:uncharacterized protein
MKIAIVGSGISGLGVAWLLSPHHRVTLFEAGDYLGGHTNTVDVSLEGLTAPVDTGFLVHNTRTYPNLISLFATLGVRTVESDMSFSVQLEAEGLEWAGSNLATVFAQPANLARPRFLGMLRDILRFNAAAPNLLEETAASGRSLGDLLEEHRYGQAFRDWYLLPMGAAIWSSPTGTMLDFPAHAFLSFCRNHGLLQITGRPRWRTVAGGARTYVERMALSVPDVRLNTPVRRVERRPDGVRVLSAAGEERFDTIVLACHSNQSLAMLGDADADERRILGAVRYQPNQAVLHTDESFLPRRRIAWSAWNFAAGAGRPDGRPVAVTYLLNRLQPLPFRRPVMVTLNPHRPPAPEHVLGNFDYAHPLMDGPAREAQRQLPLIQGRRNTWFAGAWTGYGFHEDGFNSALTVASALDARVSWRERVPA